MVMEMSKTYQYRKVMKPLLERKRRARINKCLDELKDLMVECLQQEGEHVTRLEKADILELTVEHMKKLRAHKQLRLGNLMGLTDQRAETKLSIAESFHAGYVHAADQITQVLIQQQQHDEIGGKIIKYLSMRLGEMQQQHHATTTSASAAVAAATALQMDFLPALMMPLTTSATTTTTMISPTAAATKSLPITRTACDDRTLATATAFAAMSPPPPAHRHDNELQIDVTTVENLDATSCDSLDSTASSETEIVWRPW